MIFLIWFVWFFNQFINFIIMSNFLIAIVSQSYEQTQTNCVFYEYEQRCKLNMEYGSISRAFRSLPFVSDRIKDKVFDDRGSLFYMVYTNADDTQNDSDTLAIGLVRQIKKGFQ